MSRSHFYNADDWRAAFSSSQPLSRGIFRNKRHKSHSALNFGNAPAFCVDVRESPPPMAMTQSDSPPSVGCRPTRRRYDVSQPSTSHSFAAVLPPRISQALKSLRSGLGKANLISSSSSSSKFKPAYVDADDVVYYANRDTNNSAKARAAASVREFAAATNGGVPSLLQPLNKRVAGSARNLAVGAFPAELVEDEGRSSSGDARIGSNMAVEEYYDNHLRQDISSAEKSSVFPYNQLNKHFDGSADYCNPPAAAAEKLYDELPKVDVKTSKPSIYQRNRTLAEIRQLYKSTPNFSVYDNEGDEDDDAENEDDDGDDLDYDCVVDEECCYEDDLTGHAFNHASNEAFYRQKMRRSFGAAATSAGKTTSGDRAAAAFQRYQQQYSPPQPLPSALRRGSVNVLSSGDGLLSSPSLAPKRFSQLAASLSKMSVGGDADFDRACGGKFASSCGATADGEDPRRSVVNTVRLMHTRPSPVLGAGRRTNGSGNLASVAAAADKRSTEEFTNLHENLHYQSNQPPLFTSSANVSCHHTKYSTNRSNSTVSSNASSSLEDRLRKTKAIFEEAAGESAADLTFSAVESPTIAAGSLPPPHTSSPTDSGYRSRRQTPRVKKHTHGENGQRPEAGEEADECAPPCVSAFTVNGALRDFNDRFAAGLLHSSASADTVQRFVRCMFDMLALSAATTTASSSNNNNNAAVVDNNNNNADITDLGELSSSNNDNSTPPNAFFSSCSSSSPASIPLEYAQMISRQFAIATGTKAHPHLRDRKASVDVRKRSLRLDEKDEDGDGDASLNHRRHYRSILIDPRYVDSTEMADIRFSVRRKHGDFEDGEEGERSDKNRRDEMVLVHAHRIVLANSAGGRLRRLVEDSQGAERPVVLDDLNCDTLRMMLRYLYGDVDGFVAEFRRLSTRRQVAVLRAAQRYELTALRRECEAVLIDSLSPRNCLLVYRHVSARVGDELFADVKTACEDFLLLNLPKVLTQYPAFVDDLSKSSSSMMSRATDDTMAEKYAGGGECVKEVLTKRFISVFLRSSSSS